MHRNEQVQRIRTLEAALRGHLDQAGESSRRPLGMIRHYGPWLLPGAGLAMGAILARISARHMLAGSISGAMFLLRAQRLLVRWLHRA